MSDYDPFDGNYNVYDVPSQLESVEYDEPREHPRLTRTQLVRMRRADLRKVADERGLETDGGRDDLIERIAAAQDA